MKIQQIVFSPTGGTKAVSDIISNEWKMPVEEIDLTDAETDYSSFKIEKDNIAMISVPSYAGRVPALAAQRISRLNGNQAKCVIVCVYGNRAYEDTLVELQDVAEKAGFRVIAAIAAIAEHSIMHQYATGRPDTEDKEELRRFAREILEKAGRDAPEDQALHLPGNRPYKKAGAASLVPKAGKQCVACGICAKSCPAQAINKENPKDTDSKKCISCMRCVAKCPRAARKVNEAMVSAVALAIRKACSVRKANELYI